MDSLETRELTYFVAVAEELHFGRAARRLDITQPPLSRAIKQLEVRLRVALFDRTSQRVTLTPAGEVLLHESRRILDAVAAAVRTTRRAAQPGPRVLLTIPPCGDKLLQGILAAYESEADALPVDIDVRTIGRLAHLREGHADIAFLLGPLPSSLPGFGVEELTVERPLAVLPRSHRLAGHASLRMRDLHGEPLPHWPGVTDDRWTGTGVEFRSGPLVHDAGELMQSIALGLTIALEPKSVLGPLRPDLVGIPVVDAPTRTMVIAWPEHSRSRAVAAFVRVATSIAASTNISQSPDRAQHGLRRPA
jgi:DNA-binding transcriptional LysR family regulator